MIPVYTNDDASDNNGNASDNNNHHGDDTNRENSRDNHGFHNACEIVRHLRFDTLWK